MKNNVKMLVMLLMWTTVVLTGCNEKDNTVNNPEVDPNVVVTLEEETNEGVSYDAESWKEIIPEDCTYFFDGCNNCSRIEWEDVVACTEMFCETYEEPRCTDEEVADDVVKSWLSEDEISADPLAPVAEQVEY